ncbi:MAG TPA: class I SAM-dependent methyltransferase [Ktedonobacteraceae bacterium]
MSQTPETGPESTAHAQHPRFAAYYERASRGKSESRFFEPLRRELLEQAYGQVLEVGAGTGLNFSLYQPEKVTGVEALEPDNTMLSYARGRIAQARVPINLIQGTAEALPGADNSYDCVVATLVFCSVDDPARGFQEIRRVLKPGGTLLLLEHVRAQGRFAAGLQGLLLPLTTRMAGNCHWNRNTARTVSEAGFEIDQERHLSGWLLPMLHLRATSPA